MVFCIEDWIDRFDMPFVCHADKVTYVTTWRWVMCGTENVWDAVGRTELVCCAKSPNNSNLIRDADS